MAVILPSWSVILMLLSQLCGLTTASGKNSIRFLLMYQYNGEKKPEFINEPVPSSFASSLSNEAYVSVAVVTKVTSDRTCIYTRNFGSPTLLRSSGFFITYPANDICGNNDPYNSSLLVTTFRLRPDSHYASLQTVTSIARLVECCHAYFVAAALASSLDASVLQSEDLDRLLNTASSSTHGQPPYINANNNTLTFLSKNSIFFVAISFIVLMIISLGWLAFYYVERFRNAHTKEYISKRIAKAAKKALSKMPLKTVRGSSDELNYRTEQCTVCIEQFRTNDTIRILPCKHLYHKTCIDPWLMENHTCPVCKLDILTASGIELPYGRYNNCDLDQAIVGRRSLELYPVQLDLLIHGAGVIASSPESSGDGREGGGASSEIQLVHIRPPAVQVHHIRNHFRRSFSSLSSSSSPVSHNQQQRSKTTDEEANQHQKLASPAQLRRSSNASSTEEMVKLLTTNGSEDAHLTKPKQEAPNSLKTQNKPRQNLTKKSRNCSKNVACVVDVIAPATPPLDLYPSVSLCPDPSSISTTTTSPISKDSHSAVEQANEI